VAGDPILYREEAVQLALAVHDIVDVLRRTLQLLEDGDDGEDEQG
jgi:hypothetical protein